MRELILKIINDSNIQLRKIDYKGLEIYFSTFEEEKMDFYLSLFIEYDHLIQISENVDNIEYALNRIAIEVQNEHLQEFKEKYIDKNLSFITVLKYNDDSQLFKLKKVEENYFVTKKYLLIYNDSDLSVLQEKVNEINKSNIIHTLNQLAINNGNLLDSSINNDWYILLLRLFTKLPFLNYMVKDEDKQSLEDLNKTILNTLSDLQRQLFQVLDEKFHEIGEENIEDFILDNKLFDNTANDEL